MQGVVETSAHTLVSVWLVDRAVGGFRGVGKAILEFKPLVYIGSISYGIYVFHGFIPSLMDRLERSLRLLPWQLPEGLANVVYDSC